jgi:hypothetical protein
MFRTRKRLWVIPALALALTFALVGCVEDDGDEDINKDPKTITITGISETGYAMIMVLNQNFDPLAMGMGAISINSFATLDLVDTNLAPWKGSGSFYLMLVIASDEEFDDETMYLYTDGKSWEQLQISEDMNMDAISSKLPRYNISSASSTIAFSKFKAIPEDWFDDDEEEEEEEEEGE